MDTIHAIHDPTIHAIQTNEQLKVSKLYTIKSTNLIQNTVLIYAVVREMTTSSATVKQFKLF